MTVAAADVQNLILLEVGDTAGKDLSRNMSTIWDSFSDKAQIAPRLQELYVKRRCIDIALGAIRNAVDETTEGTSVRNEQRVVTLIDMRVETEAEIGVVEERAGANRPPLVGTITKVQPQSPPTGLPPLGPPDGDDPRYSGTVYAPRAWPSGVLP